MAGRSVIDAVFGGLVRTSVRRPRLTLTLVLALIVAAAPGTLRLRLATDGHALVPPDDPAVRVDASVRERFDLRDPIVVVVHSPHPQGIYNLATLRGVRSLSETLVALDGVGADHVMSLATERRARVYPGTMEFRPFLDPLPDTPQRMETLRDDVEAASTLVRGTLVATDGRSTAILVGVPALAGHEDRVAFYRQVRDLAEAHRAPDDRVVVVGAPVAEALLGIHLLEDLAWLLPLSISLIALVIWLGCRRLWGVVLALGEVGACLVWTFGIMGWCGVPVYLTIAVLPVILTSVGLADEIHVFWHYQEALTRTGAAGTALAETMRHMTRPVVVTSLTTAIGFGAFLASPIAPVRVFGTFAALGIVFCLLWTLVVVPAVLTLLDPRRMLRPRGAAAPGPFLTGVATLVRRPWLTLTAVALVSVAAAAGATRLVVQDSWIGGFAPDSEFRRDVEEVDASYLGTHLLLVALTFDDPDGPGGAEPLLDPGLVRTIGELEGFLRDRPEVGGVQGAFSHLTTMNYLLLARRVERDSLPDTPAKMRSLLTYFDKVRGAQRRRQVIEDGFRRTVLTVFLKEANYVDTARLMQATRARVASRLAPLGARLEFAGDVAVSQAMIPAIVRTQVRSVLLALGAALLTLGVMLRSPRGGIQAVLPAAIAALWVFGVMGWLGIPLGVATSMFCAITLGIGVDYGVHFVEGVRRARLAGEPEPVEHAVAAVGPAILFDALAIGLGFGVLGLSSVPANARLGLLVALALGAGCLLTLAGLGALLRRPAA